MVKRLIPYRSFHKETENYPTLGQIFNDKNSQL